MAAHGRVCFLLTLTLVHRRAHRKGHDVVLIDQPTPLNTQGPSALAAVLSSGGGERTYNRKIGKAERAEMEAANKAKTETEADVKPATEQQPHQGEAKQKAEKQRVLARSAVLIQRIGEGGKVSKGGTLTKLWTKMREMEQAKADKQAIKAKL